ncbi:hypothetical protein H5J25_04015 [Sphingomonas aliaeris]|uniref:Uncharacterized protein n=1 Tax=Sphingomonas aliaeris TaxID=2759526 RepID=A0A974NVS7_9SPHN|nr:hypothetical protein [Sphingomonas aliaeris]QQV77924.1 hypothetical protein H5J25_04015 [Sphingomonas aliaeris]
MPDGFQEVAKVLVWSLLVDPRGEATRNIQSVCLKVTGLDRVLAWVARTGGGLADLDEEQFEYFLDELEDEIDAGRLDSSRSQRPTQGTVRVLIAPWHVLRDQAPAMAEAGVDALTFDPFVHQSPTSIVISMSGDGPRKGDPIPDEVAVAVVQAATAMLGTPADEVESALRSCMELRRTYQGGRHKVKFKASLPERSFSPLAEDGEPWLEVPAGAPWRVYESIIEHGLRRVVGACATLVFACGGQRSSEVLAVEAGIDPQTGLPACVERSRSDTHTFDLYWLNSTRFKMTDGEPEKDQWLIGCATAGDTELPDAVQAIATIHQVLAPFREIAEGDASTRLLINRYNGFRSLRGDLVRPMSYHTLRDWMHVFLAEAIEWSALPDVARDGTDLTTFKRLKGANISSRGWRRTLVQFLLRVDGRMTLPLARRLRHKMHNVINGAYQSNDPALMEEVNDAMARTLARTIVGISDGSRPVTGWLGDLLTTHIDEVRELTCGLRGEEAVTKVQAWASKRQLGLFESGAGKCGLRLMPRHALCHLVAGSAGWWSRQPADNRTDENCANCKLCVVDSEHLHFWTSRYAAARRQVLISRTIGREEEAWVHAGQAATARNMLKRLDGRIPPDNELED